MNNRDRLLVLVVLSALMLMFSVPCFSQNIEQADESNSDIISAGKVKLHVADTRFSESHNHKNEPVRIAQLENQETVDGNSDRDDSDEKLQRGLPDQAMGSGAKSGRINQSDMERLRQVRGDRSGLEKSSLKPEDARSLETPTGIEVPQDIPANELKKSLERARNSVTQSPVGAASRGGQPDLQGSLETPPPEPAANANSSSSEEENHPPTRWAWRFVENDVQLSAVSGWSENARPLDTGVELTRIKIYEQWDVPCGIVLNGDDNIHLCKKPGSKDSIVARIPASKHIANALAVCLNKKKNRVKGIHLSGFEANADGSFKLPYSDSEEQPNCYDYEPVVECPANYGARGVVAHFDIRGGDKKSDALVGLQLICHRIERFER